MRVRGAVVRRELLHPGATLDAFEIRGACRNYRHQAFTTNIARGQFAFMQGRHRAPARVKEERIADWEGHRQRHLPSRHNHINQVWAGLAVIAADLLVLAQSMLLTEEFELHRAEPRTLRYRLL
jgi:hypothetical protein